MRRLVLVVTLLGGCTVNKAEFAGRLPLADGGLDGAGDVGSGDATGQDDAGDAAADDAQMDSAPADDAGPDVSMPDDSGVHDDVLPPDDGPVQDDSAPQTDSLTQDDAPPQTDVLPQDDAAVPSDGPYTSAGWYNLTPGTLPAAWPTARSQHGLVYDQTRHVAVLFGGANNVTAFGDTWEWDGSAWTLRDDSAPPAGPGQCAAPIMTYDTARAVSVAFGCGGGDELWEWNGNAWTNRTPTPRPGAWPLHRRGSAGTFDIARGRMVLFAGYWSGPPITYYQDTWEWDSSAWTHALNGPMTLGLHAMAYDDVRAVSLVHGGTSNGSSWRLTQVLEWDGATWATRDPVGMPPPGRAQATMVYDSRRRATVLFAGYNTMSAALADTWEYDGPTRTWADRSIFTGPHVRAAHASVFDPDRGTMLVFGGAYSVSPNTFHLDDLWEYQGP